MRKLPLALTCNSNRRPGCKPTVCRGVASNCSQRHAAQVLERQQARRAVPPVTSAAQAAREAWSRSLIRRLGTLQLQDAMQLHAFADGVLADKLPAQ